MEIVTSFDHKSDLTMGKVTKCEVDGCTNNHVKDGVCYRHGATVVVNKNDVLIANNYKKF